MAKRYHLNSALAPQRILESKADAMLLRNRDVMRVALVRQLSLLGVKPDSKSQVDRMSHMIQRRVEQHGPDIVVTWHYGTKLVMRMYWSELNPKQFHLDTPRLEKRK